MQLRMSINSKMNASETTVPRTDPATPPTRKPRVLSSEALFAGDREIIIEHQGEPYRLRRTSKEKLILTK